MRTQKSDHRAIRKEGKTFSCVVIFFQGLPTVGAARSRDGIPIFSGSGVGEG